MKQRNDDTADIEAREWNRLIFGDDYWQNRLATQGIGRCHHSHGFSKEFVNSLVRSGNLVVAVAGDFEPAELEALLNKTVGSLEPLGPSRCPPFRSPTTLPEPGVYVVNKPDVNQGRVSIGRPGTGWASRTSFP